MCLLSCNCELLLLKIRYLPINMQKWNQLIHLVDGSVEVVKDGDEPYLYK